MALPKWTDERTQQLTDFVGSESPISQSTVANAADELETSTRSVSSKLRKMGFDVELASASASKSFSEAWENHSQYFADTNFLTLISLTFKSQRMITEKYFQESVL